MANGIRAIYSAKATNRTGFGCAAAPSDLTVNKNQFEI